MYNVIDSSPFITLDRLIEKLQAIQAANKSNQFRTYVLNANDEYLTHVQVIEQTLSDGSKVQDVRIVRLPEGTGKIVVRARD